MGKEERQKDMWESDTNVSCRGKNLFVILMQSREGELEAEKCRIRMDVRTFVCFNLA